MRTPACEVRVDPG